MPPQIPPATIARDGEQDVKRARESFEMSPDVEGSEESDEVLALAADVEHAAPERERDGKAVRISGVVRISVC